MKLYKNYKPSKSDFAGIGLPDRQDWFVAPVILTRDSLCQEESNFSVFSKILSEDAEKEDWEVHRFGHWACGWFEIILVKPGTKAMSEAETVETRLKNYPILDESDLSEREMEAANQVWTECYNDKQRIKYIRENRSQFDFHDFKDLLACARGRYFNGLSNELLK